MLMRLKVNWFAIEKIYYLLGIYICIFGMSLDKQ